MSHRTALPFLLGIGLGACSATSSDDDGGGGATVFTGYHADTLLLGPADNAEVIKVVPGTRQALLLSSKARKVTRLSVEDDALVELASRALFAADASESELTHLASNGDGTWGLATRTLITRDESGAATDCQGEVVVVDLKAGPTFGDVLQQVPVGPMPDAVDLSFDDAWAIVANERDVVYGKCETVLGLEPASLSLLDLRGGPANAVEAKRIVLGDVDAAREPESVAFAHDGDLIVATLQDSHEVAFLRRTEILEISSPDSDDVTLVRLPDGGPVEAAPWPDGVTVVQVGEAEVFAVAGEGNDTVTLLSADGAVRDTLTVGSSDVPAAFPRDGTWGPLFRPDSLTSFSFGERVYLAVTLKASGAVAVWDLTDPNAAALRPLVKVGHDEQSDASVESSIQPEGIAAQGGADAFLLTANEGESSVSLILAEP